MTRLFVIVLAVVGAASLNQMKLTEYDRRLGAIVGALVSDAATMPLHWIYNTTKIAELAAGQPPEFHDPPSNPYYNYTLGSNTPFGQQTLLYLRSIAKSGWSPKAQQRAYFDFYGDGECALHATKDVPCPPWQPNVTCCYWDASTKVFIQNARSNATCLTDLSCGADDTQANALAHAILPVVFGGNNLNTVLQEVNDLVRITQNADLAVAFGVGGARVLFNAIQGMTASDSITAASKAMLAINKAVDSIAVKQDFGMAAGLAWSIAVVKTTIMDVTQEVGQSCDYPNNLVTASHALNQVTAGPGANNVQQALVTATRQAILAGGESGSRSMLVGAVLGAVGGLAAIPGSWKQRYNHYEEVVELAQRILKP